MWTNELTKEQFIHRLLSDIYDKATRRKRGTTQRAYLLADLESIENLIPRIRKIMRNPKEIYTEFEIEKENLEAFSDSITRIAEKKK
jgi:hypothetical protein